MQCWENWPTQWITMQASACCCQQAHGPNLVRYFNGDGSYLHAIVALGVEKAEDHSTVA